MKQQDIASALGISVATVSNALSGKGRVSEEMRERVTQMAERLGYTPSISGRALRTGRSGFLGLVLPDLSNPLFPRIAQAVEAAAAEAGYGVLIAEGRGTADAQLEALRRIGRYGAEGVIVVPRRGTRVMAQDLPLAVIDSPSTPGNTVAADHRGGAALLAEHLLSLGHRRVVLVGAARMSNVQADRIGGLRSTLTRHAGTQVRVVWLEDGMPDLAALVAEGFTAFAATSDMHALTLMTTLLRAGLRVPEDASVAGFDDLAFSDLIVPALTSVAQDVDAIARSAVAAILAQQAGRPNAETAVPMRLVARESTAQAARAGRAPGTDDPTTSEPTTSEPTRSNR